MTTIDISKLNAETSVPALYCLSDGTYSVGYATVKVAPDKNGGKEYNIMTYDQGGNYAYTYEGTKGTPNKAYNYNNLLSNAQTYNNEQSAKEAYTLLTSQYLTQNPSIKEGK